MRSPHSAVTAILALTLVLSLVGACASAPPPSPSPTVVVQAPTPTFMPTATLRPTLTPSPQPTNTPVPTVASAGPGLALIKEAQAKQLNVKSARGLMTIAMEGTQAGKAESANMLVEFEMNEPDMRMAMKLTGAEAPMGMDIEFVVVGDTAYMNMGGEWMSFPGGQGTAKSEMDLVDMDEMAEMLKVASNVRSLGKRTVKGVECEVIGFTLSEQMMRELAEGQGSLGGDEELPKDLVFENFKGEFAIGISDKLMHQMVIGMAFYDKAKPRDRFKMDLDFTMWDINATNIVIKAPKIDGDPVSPFPAPTRLPRT